MFVSAAVLQTEQQKLSEKLIRLHVVANSDSAHDQQIKLRVRDAILEKTQPLLRGADDPRGALEAHLDEIAQAAQTCLSELGEDAPVRVRLGKELFPTREYETFALPAGIYESLRVTIGEGEGHNWWCIVFPPVCLSAVQSEQVEEAMSVEDYALITRQDGYELRFRTVELWGELLEKLEEHGWIAAGEE